MNVDGEEGDDSVSEGSGTERGSLEYSQAGRSRTGDRISKVVYPREPSVEGTWAKGKQQRRDIGPWLQ